MRITRRPALSGLTTLGLGGTCAVELAIESVLEAGEAAACLRRISLPVHVLGLGSNILGLDGHHEVALLRPDFREGPAVVAAADWPQAEGSLAAAAAAGQGDPVLVHAGAGVPLPKLLSFCRERGLSGLEGLAGIPGSVGGAVAMNAGSFGRETGDALACVEVLKGEELLRVPRAGLACAYRSFAIPGLGEPFLVAGAVFVLSPSDPAVVAAAMKDHFSVKKSRQPLAARSAGCVFKNPAQGPGAGILLDRAGFRGRERAGVALSSLHANFLVNTGSGTSTDALALLDEARSAVHDRFGVLLEYEVRMLPCRSS